MKIEVYIAHKWMDLSYSSIQPKSKFEVYTP